MGTSDLAPDDAQTAGFVMAGAGSLPLSLVDVGTFFAKVEFSFCPSDDALYSEERGGLVLVAVSPLVAGEHGLGVKPARLLGRIRV